MGKVESYGYSDIGLVRPNNEDFWTSMPRYRFFALADGMGGHNAGEVAAKKTIEFLKKSIKDAIHPQKKAKIPTKDLIYHLKSAIENANDLVFDLGRKKQQLRGMGTTLCCLYLYDDSVIYAHVGDSRIYRFRDSELKQLTEDHSLIQGLQESQAIQPSPFKHIITRAIGTSSNVEPEISSATLIPGDIFLMCSDGLSDFVPENEMETILQKSNSIRKKTHLLIDTAKQKGSNDNITIVMIKIKT